MLNTDMEDQIAVLFDMDGVIVDSNPWHKKALDIFFQRNNLKVSEEDLKTKLWGRANKDWIPDIFDVKLSKEEVRSLSLEKEAIWREIYEGSVEPVKGLEAFLEQLKEAKVLATVSTSATTENVKFVLEATAFERFFDAIIDERSFSVGKPDPEVYLTSAMALGIGPEHCIVIEDSLSGVKAGKAAGMKVIGITTTHSKAELSDCDSVIDDFTQLSVQDLNALLM